MASPEPISSHCCCDRVEMQVAAAGSGRHGAGRRGTCSSGRAAASPTTATRTGRSRILVPASGVSGNRPVVAVPRVCFVRRPLDHGERPGQVSRRGGGSRFAALPGGLAVVRGNGYALSGTALRHQARSSAKGKQWRVQVSVVTHRPFRQTSSISSRTPTSAARAPSWPPGSRRSTRACWRARRDHREPT